MMLVLLSHCDIGVQLIPIRRYIFAAFFETTSYDFFYLVYRCGLEKRTLYFDIFFNEMFLTCRVPTFRGQKEGKHGGPQGISFLFIDCTMSKLEFCGSPIVI